MRTSSACGGDMVMGSMEKWPFPSVMAAFALVMTGCVIVMFGGCDLVMAGYFFGSDFGSDFVSFFVGLSGTNFSTMPLMQYLWLVGVLKPSPLNRCPRCALHFAQSTSVRTDP